MLEPPEYNNGVKLLRPNPKCQPVQTKKPEGRPALLRDDVVKHLRLEKKWQQMGRELLIPYCHLVDVVGKLNRMDKTIINRVVLALPEIRGERSSMDEQHHC